MSQYQAKGRYQSSEIVNEYETVRFTTWYGKLAHQIEVNAFENALEAHCKESGSVLDLPCGTGRLLSCLLKRGHTVTGGDISEEMLSFARSRFKNEPKISFQKMDGEELPFEMNHFDYLTSYRFMCHLPREIQKKVLSEMIRVTRKIIILNYHFNSWAPLAVFNQLFRKYCLPLDPLPEKSLFKIIGDLGGRVLHSKRLSWYERSSALIVIQKK